MARVDLAIAVLLIVIRRHLALGVKPAIGQRLPHALDVRHGVPHRKSRRVSLGVDLPQLRQFLRRRPTNSSGVSPVSPSIALSPLRYLIGGDGVMASIIIRVAPMRGEQGGQVEADSASPVAWKNTISQIPPNGATAPIRGIGWELSSELLTWYFSGAPLRNRTVDLLLTMDRRSGLGPVSRPTSSGSRQQLAD